MIYITANIRRQIIKQEYYSYPTSYFRIEAHWTNIQIFQSK